MRQLVAALIALTACGLLPDEPLARVGRPSLEVSPATTPPVYVYRPATPGPHRVVVWAHQGGWWSGTATLGGNSIGYKLVAHGFAVASVEYTLSTVAPWPRQIEDMRAAVQWLRAKGDSLGLLTDRIGAGGYSAGAHLAAHLGTSCTVAAECVQAVWTVAAPVDFLTEDAQLAARGCPSPRANVVGSQEWTLLGGVLPSVSPWTAHASPLTTINAGDPPFLVFHGLYDCTVPVAQAGQLAARLTAAGVPVQRYQYQTGHGATVFATDSAMARVVAFFHGVL